LEDNNNLIVNIYTNFMLLNDNKPTESEFKKYISELIKNNSESFNFSKGSSKTDNSWRAEQKALFSGRGRQWIYVSLDKINKVLDHYHNDLGKDLSDYKANVEKHGKAWVRYSGPRINPASNKPCAAFEIRYQGSKIPQTDTYYAIDHDECFLLTEEDRLEDGKTPHQLGLEVNIQANKKVVNTEKIQTKQKKQDKKSNQNKSEFNKIFDELNSVEITNDIPASNNPQEWEDFLKKEGLSFEEELN